MKFKHIIASAAVAAGLLTLGSCQSKLDIPQHSVTNIGSQSSTHTGKTLKQWRKLFTSEKNSTSRYNLKSHEAAS